MRNPAEIAVRQPRVVLLATVLCVLYGVLSYLDLPRQENPRLADRFATVTSYLPGAAPEQVERLVSEVLERKISEVDDVRDLFSSSVEGRSHLIVEIEGGAPLAQRLQQVRDKVQEARAELPTGASDPEVDTETLNTYTMVLVLAGAGADPRVLRRESRALERALERLPGVRAVDLVGRPEEEIEVAVDLRELSQRGAPLSRVLEALARRDPALAAGELEVGPLRSSVRAGARFESTGQVAATYLGSAPDGLPIRLSDVSRVRRRLAEPDVLVRFGEDRGVALAVEMLPHRNAIAFGDRVRAFLADWERRLPAGLRVEIAADEPTYVADRLALLTGSLLVGLVIVVCLTLFGMGWRSGAIVSVSIPLSLTVSMGLLGLAGVELHQISIAALVIAIGLVVDEAIVVTDNVQRHLDRGATPRQAAIDGLGEIHLAVLAGAATTVAAFIPLMLMEGDTGDFLRGIPVAVSCMLAASVAVAHFVTPLLAAWAHGWSRSSTPRRAGRVRRAELRYRQLLGFAVARGRLMLALFAVFFAASLALLAVRLWPPVFFPAADRHQFLIEVRLPDGARLEETDAVMRAVGRRLDGEPQVRDWTAFVGADAPKFFYNEFSAGRGESLGMLIVNTDPSLPFHRTGALVKRLEREFAASVPGARVRPRELRQGYQATADVRVYVMGESLPHLRALSRRVREIAEDIPGIARVREGFGYDSLRFEARVRDAMANLLGIERSELAVTLRTALDGVTAATLREDDAEIPIRVRLAPEQRNGVEALRAIGIHSPASGRSVPLAQLASLEADWTTREIMRFNRQREAVIDADVVGRPASAAAADLERAVRAQLAPPDGYELLFRGEREEVNESFLSLAKAALLAVFLIYGILVLRFQSLSQPLLIVLAIPMALIGSIWGLALTGHDLGLTAFLGMIALTGIVVNDSIVLLDYVNTLRRRGYELEDAVMSGATTRLRAVVLTSLTTMGGLLPLALGGGAFWSPFALAMVFGLGASTALTLLLQPAAYLMLERRRRRRSEGSSPRSAARLALSAAESLSGT